MRVWIRAALVAAFGTVGLTATAADIALLLGNSNYGTLPDYRNGTNVREGRPEMTRAGIAVTQGLNTNSARMKSLVAEFLQAAPSADGVVIALSGRFARTSQETYFLPVDTGAPSLAELPEVGLPLSTALTVLADVPGRAVLILSTDRQQQDFAPYVSMGLGPLEIPQGVTVVTGTASAVGALVENVIPARGRDMMQVIANNDGLRVRGFAPDAFVFLQAGAPAPRPNNEAARLDAELWETVRELDTIEGYESYLDRFPRGRFVREARAAIEDIRSDPVAIAQRAEENLNLTRDDRRAIQSDLSLLDYNTRGIDGIFGPGTRRAITTWQQDQGFNATGFLNRNQVRRLASLADERQAVLEEEAARRAAEEAERDRAFWARTGAQGDEAGYRAYLEEFPDGRFAELANARLRVIERERRENASAVERLFWEQANENGTIDGYRRYLGQFPQGVFADEARSRIAEIEETSEPDPALVAAQRAEDALNLNANTRRTIEARLNALGLKPGRVDGEFTDETRRAIRRYQQARRLNATGYLSETTVVRIFADAVISIFD